MRVLLSDGSGLTARQCATQLAAAGHEVGVLSADPFALTRFTRHVRRFHRVPPFGDEPMKWMSAALVILDRERALGRAVDVLLPTQEQVVVLTQAADDVRSRGVYLAVPTTTALGRVFDKVSAAATMDALGVPQPPTVIARDRRQLLAHTSFPVFVKAPLGTATTGVRLVSGAAQLIELATKLGDDVFVDGGLVLQQPVRGELVMVQGVFDAGRLIAWHANARTREGVNGGASGKRSTPLAAAAEYLVALGEGLGWHGALSFDLIVPTDSRPPVVIDTNPRLVEPGNAWRAGTDLVAAMLAVSRGDHPTTAQRTSQPDAATHQLLLAVLAAAAGGRRAVCHELLDAVRHRGPYDGSAEELTPLSHDPLTAVPIVVAAVVALLGTRLAHRLSAGTVSNYALSVHGWRQLRSAAA
jgi:biotin carboxylase